MLDSGLLKSCFSQMPLSKGRPGEAGLYSISSLATEFGKSYCVFEVFVGKPDVVLERLLLVVTPGG